MVGKPPDITITDVTPTISSQEVEDAIVQLPNNKAPDIDNCRIPEKFRAERDATDDKKISSIIPETTFY